MDSAGFRLNMTRETDTNNQSKIASSTSKQKKTIELFHDSAWYSTT